MVIAHDWNKALCIDVGYKICGARNCESLEFLPPSYRPVQGSLSDQWLFGDCHGICLRCASHYYQSQNSLSKTSITPNCQNSEYKLSPKRETWGSSSTNNRGPYGFLLFGIPQNARVPSNSYYDIHTRTSKRFLGTIRKGQWQEGGIVFLVLFREIIMLFQIF